MSYGFVYALSNPSMPGIYKIGFTTKHPKDRMEELSKATACPTPFELMAYIGCENPQAVEGAMHEAWKDSRVNSSREFFRITAAQIAEMMAEHSEEDAVFDDPLIWKGFEEERAANQQFCIDLFFSQCADPIFWFRGFE